MSERELIGPGVLSRYDLSYYGYRRLQSDHIRFEQQFVTKFPNGFICRILINYMSYAQENFLDSFEAEVSALFEKKQYNDYFRAGERITFTAELTNKMSEFDFFNNIKFKKRIVITYILDKFTALPISEREKIYCSSQYTAILKAIQADELLLLKNSEGNEFEVKPYDIAVDDNSLSYYLIGYSGPRNKSKAFTLHSFKLSRIKECRSKHSRSGLSPQESKNAKEISEIFGAAYMVANLKKSEIERSVVRLTEYGYKNLYLKAISRQRPIPVSEPKPVSDKGKQYFDLEFDCSHNQIRNYFFSFGKEAEVISPEPLRNRFIKDYKEASARYCNDD